MQVGARRVWRVMFGVFMKKMLYIFLSDCSRLKQILYNLNEGF